MSGCVFLKAVVYSNGRKTKVISDFRVLFTRHIRTISGRLYAIHYTLENCSKEIVPRSAIAESTRVCKLSFPEFSSCHSDAFYTKKY